MRILSCSVCFVFSCSLLTLYRTRHLARERYYYFFNSDHCMWLTVQGKTKKEERPYTLYISNNSSTTAIINTWLQPFWGVTGVCGEDVGAFKRSCRINPFTELFSRRMAIVTKKSQAKSTPVVELINFEMHQRSTSRFQCFTLLIFILPHVVDFLKSTGN